MGGPTTWTKPSEPAPDGWQEGVAQRQDGAFYVPMLGLLSQAAVFTDPGPVAWSERSTTAAAYVEQSSTRVGWNDTQYIGDAPSEFIDFMGTILPINGGIPVGLATWTEANRSAPDGWGENVQERVYGAAFLPLLGLVPVSDIPVDPGAVTWQKPTAPAGAFSESAASSTTTWAKAGN